MAYYSPFFLLTITGRNEDIIVELKALFVMNDTNYHLFWDSHNRFPAITKNDDSSRL